MCSGLFYGYPYKTTADNYVDEFSARGGTVIFESQDGIGRIVAYDEGGYRTITSSVIFSAFDESGKMSRLEMLEACVEFLTEGTGLESGTWGSIKTNF